MAMRDKEQAQWARLAAVYDERRRHIDATHVSAGKMPIYRPYAQLTNARLQAICDAHMIARGGDKATYYATRNSPDIGGLWRRSGAHIPNYDLAIAVAYTPADADQLPWVTDADLPPGVVRKLRADDMRLFVIDTEAATRGGHHILTHICLTELHIAYEEDRYTIGRSFAYDYDDEWVEPAPAPERLKCAMGGCSAFVMDLVAGLFANSYFFAHNMLV